MGGIKITDGSLKVLKSLIMLRTGGSSGSMVMLKTPLALIVGRANDSVIEGQGGIRVGI